MMLIKPVPLDNDGLSLTEYTGSKADLIASGVAREDMFPIGRKRVLNQRYGNADFKDYHVWSTRRVKGGLFKVKVWRIKEREQPRPAPWKDEADFRQGVLETAEIMLATLVSQASGELEKKNSGTISYRYSLASLQRLAELSEEIAGLLGGGEIEHMRSGKVVHLDRWRNPPTH